MRLPQLSIATKLYAIFVLLAAVTVGLGGAAVISAHRHAVLAEEYQTAYAGAMNVERVDALIYAVVMESRGIYMSSDIPTAKIYGDGLLVFNKRIGDVVNTWRRSVGTEDKALFDAFSQRIRQFQEFRRELVRRGVEASPAAGREWGDNDANRTVRKALNKDLEALAEVYAKRSQIIYTRIDQGINQTAWWLSLFAVAAVMLAAFGACIIWRSIARPLAAITHVTAQVAGGDVALAVPYGGRRDEIGALARSISVFQDAMRRNAELNKTVVLDAQARAQRQEQISAEIARFGTDIEASLFELGRLFDHMLGASSKLTEVADHASAKTAGATAASSEASANVRDIASAADELAVSVTEIDRQVAQSNAIAEKAVGEAARTNKAVKELDEAAGRADQPAGAQRHHRGGARRRCRPRLCGGGRRSQGALGADREGDRGYRRADFRHAGRHQALDRCHRRHRADHPRDRRNLERDRNRGDRTGRGHAGNRPQRRDRGAAHQRHRRRGRARRRGDGKYPHQRGVSENARR
jgi:methyl-accepting chemotaxis protein